MEAEQEPLWQWLWPRIFGGKPLPQNVRHERIHRLFTAAHAAYLLLREQFWAVLGNSADVQARYLLLMFEFHIPMALLM